MGESSKSAVQSRSSELASSRTRAIALVTPVCPRSEHAVEDVQIISWTVCKELVCMFDRVGRYDAVELAEMTLSMGLSSSHGESSFIFCTSSRYQGDEETSNLGLES